MAYNWAIVLYFFLGGLSAGCFVTAVAASYWRVELKPLAKIAALAAPIALAIGLLILMLDLGRPMKGYRIILNFNPSSAISWGTLFLTIFMVLSSAFAFLLIKGQESKAKILGHVGLLFAVLVATYTAVLLGQAPGKDLWNSGVLPVMFLAGVPWYYLAAAVALGGGAFYHLVAATPYRLQRVLVLLDPWSQTNPSAYQSQQSLIAILSGGWRGVGLGNGVRKLGFLPEDSTDFIFAGFCEEWGFRGAILLMGLMLIWTWNFRRAASRASEPLGRVLAASLGVMIVLQGLMHIAVNLVMLPPTGISMPFVSAGGTALVLMAAAAAIIVSVTGHREGMTKPRIVGT